MAEKIKCKILAKKLGHGIPPNTPKYSSQGQIPSFNKNTHNTGTFSFNCQDCLESNKIGEGGEGVVFSVNKTSDTDCTNNFVIKRKRIIENNRPEIVSHIFDEILFGEINQGITHYIYSSPVCYFRDELYLYIVFKRAFCSLRQFDIMVRTEKVTKKLYENNQDLVHFSSKDVCVYPETFFQKLTYDMAFTLDYLWSNYKITFNDLKPGNILIDSAPELKFVICDLGCATIDSPYVKKQNFGSGTFIYRPPESFLIRNLPNFEEEYFETYCSEIDGNKKANISNNLNAYRSSIYSSSFKSSKECKSGTKIDTWALGITILELFTGCHPFVIKNENEVLTRNYPIDNKAKLLEIIIEKLEITRQNKFNTEFTKRGRSSRISLRSQASSQLSDDHAITFGRQGSYNFDVSNNDTKPILYTLLEK